MAQDSGIVTIYDTKNNYAPLRAHRIDAKVFLAHPSGRWSASPTAQDSAVKNAEPIEQEDDSGDAILMKGKSMKTLRTMAEKALIPGAGEMKRSELVEALMKKEAAGNIPPPATGPDQGGA